MCEGLAQLWRVVEDKQLTGLETRVEDNTILAWQTSITTAETYAGDRNQII
jgi:hypothetical protein